MTAFGMEFCSKTCSRGRKCVQNHEPHTGQVGCTVSFCEIIQL